MLINDCDFPKPVVIDNVLPSQIADDIEHTLLSGNFSWYLLKDIARKYNDSEEYIPNYGFTHLFALDGRSTSEYYSLVKEIPHFAFSKIDMDCRFKVDIARTFMHVKPSEKEYDDPHIDVDKKHIVCLYYVNSSDGDTVIFSENDNKVITQRVTPKKNRAILFNGNIWHASTSPTNGLRAIVNFNLVSM